MERIQTPCVAQRLSGYSQDITGKASKLLQGSSTAFDSAPGANPITTSTMGVERAYTDARWYYLFLRNRELKQYHQIFSGKQPLVTGYGEAQTTRWFNYRTFAYTSADHKRRMERSSYTKEEYKSRKETAQEVKVSFQTHSTEMFNHAMDVTSLTGDGYLFVHAPLNELQQALDVIYPRPYLIVNHTTDTPVSIPEGQMQEFIYLYESMPWDFEVMEHALSDYTQRKQKIRITGGFLKGNEGCIMRMHRNSKLVFAIGNLTIATGNFHVFPFERV